MIGIKADASEIERAAPKVAKQLRYAFARSLTEVAKEAQAALKQDLPNDFTIRKPWVEKGIRIEPATRATLTAAVGSKDAFMELQAEGGEKQPHEADNVAVPVAARDPKTKVTPRSRWPRASMTRGKRKAFAVPSQKGQVLLIYQRVGKERTPLRLLWILRASVKVPKRWKLAEVARAKVAERFPEILAKRMAEALATMR